MLGTTDALATVAVKDLKAAKAFYEGKLGLTLARIDEANALMFTSGKSTLLVYPSQHAGTNKATAVTWVVGDKIRTVVEALKERGVAFEHYDLPGMTREGDVHVAGEQEAAWCKDPDGNVLALVRR
jgi:catechol 2,3-dioxygenase-like lactoylglutathione lyase family enzyme